MTGDLAGRLAAIDLRISDATVLVLIDGRTDVTSSRIGCILDIKRANMVPLLNRLETAGLIRREAIDRKSLAIVLTEEGQARLGRAHAIIAQFEADMLARIPEEHRDHLLPALDALWR